MAECHICKENTLEEVTTNLKFVSSDVVSVSGSACFAVCALCANIQKITDAKWRAAIDQVYSDYMSSTLLPDYDQVIFNASASLPRSRQLLAFINDNIALGNHGKVLDFGCSGGQLLRSFRREYPSWHLSGWEINDQHRDTVLSIPGKVSFFGSGQTPKDEKFDLITLSHVLEHLQNPVERLKTLRSILKPEGRLILSVPNIAETPFDLLILDHCTHFQMEGLKRVLEKAGFTAEIETDNWLPKELTIIASPRRNSNQNAGQLPASPKELAQAKSRLQNHLRWLEDQKAILDRINGNFAVFGSSIAACWCASEFGKKVSFFVDENEVRHNKKFMGKKIYSPENAPKDIPIFIALPPQFAQKVAYRLTNNFSKIVLPTEL